MKGERTCPDLQVETSLLKDLQVTKIRKIFLECLHGGRKDFNLEPRSDIQHCSEWETILKGWKSGAQLVIEFQNQGMATLEYIPWEGGKEDSAGQEHSQLFPTSHNTKTGSRIAKSGPAEPRIMTERDVHNRENPEALGKVVMKVIVLTDQFRKLAKKESLVNKGPAAISSPKRKLVFKKSQFSSPTKRNKLILKKIIPGIETTSSLVTELASVPETNRSTNPCTD